jgi:L-ascorbate metabolism protein UlaG (beta-lactamase superfamily)
MEVTWFGHSFFRIETANDVSILIDPYMEDNPMNDVAASDLSPDIVAVTHGDHLDHAGEAHEFDATIVCQNVAAMAYKKQDVEDVRDMNVGGTLSVKGVEFTMTHAHHSIGSHHEEDLLMLVDGVPKTREYGGVGTGFVIDDGETRFYHAGDTGLFGDMETVIGDVYQPDVAAVPIGDEVTMGPEYAATAVEWLGVDSAFPMHYDTWPRIEQDPQEFADRVSEAEVFVPDVGDTVTV